MKPMFFQALTANDRDAQNLSAQADAALGPFARYLKQAIFAAKERQTRYALPWRRVEESREVFLDPLDTRLLIHREPPAWILTGFPAAVSPDPTQPLMIVNRAKMLSVSSYKHRLEGIEIVVDGDLLPDDKVFWCSHPCTLVRADHCAAPNEVEDEKGNRYEVVHLEEQDGRGFLVHVRGRVPKGKVLSGGQALDVDRLPDFPDDLWVYEGERRFRVQGMQLVGEEMPKGDLVRADGELRFRLHDKGRRGREERLIELLLPETTRDDDHLDPRAAFCEDEVKVIWTQPFKRDADIIKVLQVNREQYRLRVERFPQKEEKLVYLPFDVRNLSLQQRALRQLREAPLPHHRGLLRLCEDPRSALWPKVEERWPERWFYLRDLERDGTKEQRRFVAKALGNPNDCDVMVLEGPPGSGKTTAICELVRQSIERGERVLLCASTHVAIDNVLEKLVTDPDVYAVRVGVLDKVDDNVRLCQLDERSARLADELRPAFPDLSNTEIMQLAERTVIMSANLTCGTTMGIINHPLFRNRDEDLEYRDRPIATMPHWDVLIVDEASKTTVQEFLVPAMMARRHVVVGDVRQLPPFTDRDDLLANLRALVDQRERPIFSLDHQRATLLMFRLWRDDLAAPLVRWLVAEPVGVIEAMANEIANFKEFPLCVVRIVTRRAGNTNSRVVELSVDECLEGDPRALWLAAADWVLVESEVLHRIAHVLPSSLLLLWDRKKSNPPVQESSALLFRTKWWEERAGNLGRRIRERGREIDTFAALAESEGSFLGGSHDWAGEMAWRLTRLHELRHSKRERERARIDKEIEQLLPALKSVAEAINDIEGVGLPSILEVMQEGIGRTHSHRATGLTQGIGSNNLTPRFVRLSFQHRMHPQISEFPRDEIYEGQALRDANTIPLRDKDLAWDFEPTLPSRRVFINVHGQEHRGTNQAEIDVIETFIRTFIEWAARKGPPKGRRPAKWEIACLCFYLKQNAALAAMLRRVTKVDKEHRFSLDHVEIVCGTVDRFQGREADLVLLSMRNTGRVGFLDSPNRLNVGLTRARQQLIIVGNADYYAERCGVPELIGLAKKTRILDGRLFRSQTTGGRSS